MVPMHLGLVFKDGTIVPYDLVSTQESPVPLPNLYPRLKILMAFRSKKGIQIYFSFLSKVPANEPPQGSPTGPLWRERPAYRAFCISLKNIIFQVPSKGALPQGPLHGIPRWEMPHHYSPPSFIYRSPRYTSPPPPYTRFPSGGEGPHGERCPYPETFFNISSRVPSVGATKPPPRSLFRDWCSIPRTHSIHLSRSPVDEPSSRFPKQGPNRKRCPSPEPFLHILQGPQQGSPPSKFPSQSSHRERHSTSTAPFRQAVNVGVKFRDLYREGCRFEPCRLYFCKCVFLFSNSK